MKIWEVWDDDLISDDLWDDDLINDLNPILRNTESNRTVRGRFQIPANNYLFKTNNRNTRKRCEIGSKLTIKTSERRH